MYQMCQKTELKSANFTCTEEIFADGTFKWCPKYFQQLYTIHGFKNGHYIPLVFCPLPSKSWDCHRKRLSLLNKCCANSNVVVRFASIHLVFEERMHTVGKELYPEAVIKSCRFHLGQSWWPKIQWLHVAKEYKLNEWLVNECIIFLA